jgi:hypothetical protein
MQTTVQGIIGNGGMKPMITWDWKERRNRQNGQMERKRVPFIRFSMLCEDTTKEPKFNPATGREQRPREIVQVILPENDRGLKLFQSLAPGRLVQVDGRLTHQPSVGKNSQGEQVLYANTKVYMRELTFMDSPIDRQIDRLVSLMKDAKVEVNGSVISDETGAAIKDGILAHLATQQEPYGPVREIIDRTKVDELASNNEAPESLDPNEADFNQ